MQNGKVFLKNLFLARVIDPIKSYLGYRGYSAPRGYEIFFFSDFRILHFLGHCKDDGHNIKSKKNITSVLYFPNLTSTQTSSPSYFK